MTEPTELLPCPFCGAGESQIHVNKGAWNGRGYGEPVSVEVRHWCADVPGQPSRMISRAGRDEASAIAAWNTRTTPQPTQAQAGAVPPIECDTEELKRAYAFGWWSALEKQREALHAGAVPPAEREPLTEVQIERAAKKLAECMDYPWGHMPTIGREEMRIHARAVLEAARLEKAP